MSTRNAFFGVPRRHPVGLIVLESRIAARSLEDCPDQIYLLFQPEKAVGDLRWFTFAGSGDPGLYPMEYFYEAMAGTFENFVVAGHDDMHGIFKFLSPALSMVSDGPLTHILDSRVRLTVDYPQKGFTNAELEALNDKDDSELSDRELAAVSSYWDAVTIGLGQLFPAEPRRAYLSVGQGDCYSVFERTFLGNPKKVVSAARAASGEMTVARR